MSMSRRLRVLMLFSLLLALGLAAALVMRNGREESHSDSASQPELEYLKKVNGVGPPQDPELLRGICESERRAGINHSSTLELRRGQRGSVHRTIACRKPAHSRFRQPVILRRCFAGGTMQIVGSIYRQCLEASTVPP